MIEILDNSGLIEGSLATTKPISRMEIARLIIEAQAQLSQLPYESNLYHILKKLRKEFYNEMVMVQDLALNPFICFFKPIYSPNLSYTYSDKEFDRENQNGETLTELSHLRFSLSSELRLFNHISFFVRPEFHFFDTYKKVSSGGYEKEWENDNKFLEGYLKIQFKNIEIQTGRSSQWWGPGYHGALILSNNTKPFDMIKISNTQPVLLPWFFQYLGPFRFVTFITKLEEDRTIPQPKLFGLRINFRPYPLLELGLSRSIMFGGGDRDDHFSLEDYWKIFWAYEENKPGKLDNNQIAGFDLVFRLPHLDPYIPFLRSLTLYSEVAGEDEAGGLPSRKGYLFGIVLGDLFLTGKTNLRFEYANNHLPGHPNLWYSHNIYKSGYTYQGKIIGHHMGSDAEDLFFKLTHYLTPDLIMGLSYDWMEKGLSSTNREKRYYGEIDFRLFLPLEIILNGYYHYEHTRFSSGLSQENHITALQFTYSF